MYFRSWHHNHIQPALPCLQTCDRRVDILLTQEPNRCKSRWCFARGVVKTRLICFRTNQVVLYREISAFLTPKDDLAHFNLYFLTIMDDVSTNVIWLIPQSSMMVLKVGEQSKGAQMSYNSKTSKSQTKNGAVAFLWSILGIFIVIPLFLFMFQKRPKVKPKPPTTHEIVMAN